MDGVVATQRRNTVALFHFRHHADITLWLRGCSFLTWLRSAKAFSRLVTAKRGSLATSVVIRTRSRVLFNSRALSQIAAVTSGSFKARRVNPKNVFKVPSAANTSHHIVVPSNAWLPPIQLCIPASGSLLR